MPLLVFISVRPCRRDDNHTALVSGANGTERRIAVTRELGRYLT
jgi:hypothetical protein